MLLKHQFFPEDDAMVLFGKESWEAVKVAINSALTAGTTNIPKVLRERLTNIMINELTDMVADSRSICLALNVLVDGQMLSLLVNNDATVSRLLEKVGYSLKRDLTSEHYVVVRNKRALHDSNRRGTIAVNYEELPMTATLRELKLTPNCSISCVVKKTDPSAVGSGPKQRIRVFLTSKDVRVERPLDDSTVLDFATSVYEAACGGVAPKCELLLVKFRFPPMDLEKRNDDWEVLNLARTITSYNIDPRKYQLLCCTTLEWEANSSSSSGSGEMSVMRQWLNIILDWPRHKSMQSVSVKEKLRGGIPHWARGCIWALLLDGCKKKEENPGLYSSLIVEVPMRLSSRWESDRQVIFRDICRTFPNIPFFQSGEGQKALEHILLAWHSFEPEIGYCQGINFVAAILLLEMEEELAFWCLHTLLKERGLQELYRSGLPLLSEAIDIFQNVIEKQLPQLASFFALNDVMITSFASPWFHTLFSWRFPLPLVLRVFDIFLREGFSIVFRLGLALLKEWQAVLMTMDCSEVLLFLQDPEKLLGDLSCEDWIAKALKIKKQAQMNIAASSSTQARMASSQLFQMARKVSSNIKHSVKNRARAFSTDEHFEYPSTSGPEAMWTQPDEGLVLYDNKTVAAGSTEKLVEILTAPHYPGQLYTHTFLLTFRSFVTPAKLAELLKLRLQHIPKPEGMSKSEFETDIVAPIQLRVFNTVRLWILSFPRDFDSQIVQKEIEAAADILASRQEEMMSDRIKRAMSSRPRPVRPIHPSSKNLSSFKTFDAWEDIPVPVFAYTLSLLDHAHYVSCQPNHLLQNGATSQSVIKWNAKFGAWVEGSVLCSKDRRSAVSRFQYFVSVAEHGLAHFYNVSGAMVITSALFRSMDFFEKDQFLIRRQPSR